MIDLKARKPSVEFPALRVARFSGRALVEVCAAPVADGIVFDLAGIQGERIKEDAEYGGVRVRVPASLDRARISKRIDIGFGDPVDPPPPEITPPVLLPLGAGFRSGSGRVQVEFRVIHLISLVSAHTSAENTVGFSHGNELL